MIYEDDTKLQDSLVGVSILGQFHIVRVLAEGGMGTIYLAEQEAMERYAAIKIVRAGPTWRPEWQLRFRQEARAASRLKHPNIVTVYNFGELADGSLFLAMEYIEGVTLSQLLAERPPLPQALSLARQIAAALAHAHRMRVVHCDLKPDNIMITQVAGGDLVKVLDFGISRLAESTQQTQPGELVGTPRYMSPEQCRGEMATALADQYAFGLLLYELVAGQPAIRADTVLGYLHRHQHYHPPLPSSHTSRVLEPLDPIVARLMAKQPEERYRDMQQALDALDEVTRKLEGGLRDVATELESERTLVDRPRRGLPIPVLVHGPLTLVSEEGKRALEERGYELEVEQESRVPVPGALRLVALPGEGWKARWQQQIAKSRPGTLFCIDTLLTTPLTEAADLCGNLLVGPHPLDPMPLLTALDWMRKGEPGGIECALPGEAIQMLQVTSSMDKASYMNSILEDAQNEGMRHRVRESLAAIGEEMILNAIFHAPVNERGVHHYAEVRRSAPLVLRQGEEATLRWLIGNSYVAIGILDGFGSISAHDVLSRTTGTGHRPVLSSDGGGAGMGLNIMVQAAQHLSFAICPGTWCEVLALVPREPMAKNAARSLCLLREIGSRTCRIGSRLRMREKVLGDGVRVEIVGDIDESADLHPVFVRRGKVHIDLAGVGRVNSIGIRAWIDALRARDGGVELFMERCSPSVVNQINLIPALTEGIEVVSFFAPYYCPLCQSESLELLHAVEIDTPPPPRCCPRCRGDLVFDAMAEEYFAFVANN